MEPHSLYMGLKGAAILTLGPMYLPQSYMGSKITQHLRTLVPKDIHLVDLLASDLEYWVLGPLWAWLMSGSGSCRAAAATSVVALRAVRDTEAFFEPNGSV